MLDNCQNTNLDPDPRIAACDQLIHANIASHGVLAALYNNRGAAYEAKKDVEHAAQDYEKALTLKSDFPEAQTNLDRLKSEKRTDVVVRFRCAANAVADPQTA